MNYIIIYPTIYHGHYRYEFTVEIPTKDPRQSFGIDGLGDSDRLFADGVLRILRIVCFEGNAAQSEKKISRTRRKNPESMEF